MQNKQIKKEKAKQMKLKKIENISCNSQVYHKNWCQNTAATNTMAGQCTEATNAMAGDVGTLVIV